mmetsp:Transcript_24364/g.50669  ORF Transcript_24364/g.50669 Transcript_24364/m.50669 type:complete len:255 (+) Transcript_24364:409-1173(+)
MLRLSVVPDGNGARAPAVADGERRPLHPLRQVAQQHGALLVAQLHDAAREVLAHVEQLLASHGMRPHDGMYRRLLGVAVRVRVVEGSEAIAKLLHRRGKRVVGLAERSPHGITANVRALDHMQNRHLGGLIPEGQVGVPLVGHATLRGSELKDLGEVLDVAGDVRRVWMGFQRSEEAAEPNVALLVELLPRKEEDTVIGQQLGDGPAVLRRRLRQVRTPDLCAQRPGQAAHFPSGGQRHCGWRQTKGGRLGETA